MSGAAAQVGHQLRWQVAFDWNRWACMNGGTDVVLSIVQLTPQAKQHANVVGLRLN